nr:hypothetical protein CFP56_60441 [Quercus suber]
MGSQHIEIKINPQSPSSSKTLSIQHSYDEKDCHTYPNQIVVVMEQREQKLNNDAIQAFEATFKLGWVDSDKAIGDKSKHKGTEQMGIHATGVKLERVKMSGVKKGRWTRLSSRVGVDNLQTSSFNS